MQKTKISHPDRDPAFATGAYSDGVLVDGANMENIVKCTVHLADINEFDRYNKVYATYFPGIKPARTTVQSVLAEGIRVEIDCIVKL
jgi:2-iminobutanoate/2-iminopropanoate deaminase